MSNTFYPFFQPTGYWGGIIRAVLGRGGGKFKQSGYNYLPIGQKLIMVDVAPGSLMNVAMQVPHLNTVICTGAELFASMVVKHLDKNGEEMEDSKVLKFLKKPNPLQTLSQYLFDFYVLNSVYNKTFQHKITRFSNPKIEPIPQAMWLLPSGWMKINATGKVYRQTSIDEIIVNYELLSTEQNETFEVAKIIYMAEGVGNNILNPVSRIEALQIPLSNIVASLKSSNIIVSQMGPKGILSPEAIKDGDGIIPLPPDHHKLARQDYKEQYDLDSLDGHIAFSSTPMKWMQMSYNVAELQLNETIESAFSAICDAFRHDRDLYSSTKGATYENKAAGLKSTIQNALQPLADKLMEQWTHHLIDENSGEKLVASYQHLPSMQEDALKEAQARKTETERLSVLYKDNIIQSEQYATDAEVDFETVPNAPQNASQANLRGLVGSVTGIIQVNQFVAQGFIDKPTGVNILMSVYGYDITTATNMITNNTVDLSLPAPSTTIAAQ